VNLLVAWVAVPLLLALLCLGAGLFVETLAGDRLPGAALIPLGLCAIVVAGVLATAISALAPATTPLVIAIALAGFAWGRPLRDLRPDPWAAAAAIAVFAVFAAPIVVSGQATFAGYIKLDDTATWLALTDRIMDHGRDISSLPPSSYEATLAFNLGQGYPIGAFIPLGVAHEVTRLDSAWAFQPYLAFLGATLALGLTTLVRPVVRSAPGAAIAAFLAAQPALLYGYYLWGGVKEVMTAAILAVAALLAARAALSPEVGIRGLVPLAVALAALLGVLGLGGAIWLVPLLAASVAIAWVALGIGPTIRRAVTLAVEVAVLIGPLIAAGTVLPPTSSPLTSAGALGNLYRPLRVFQAVGVWPVGDFRGSPTGAVGGLTGALIAIALAAAGIGAWRAWRARGEGLLLFALGGLASGLAILIIGSPWVGAKALATASVCVPALAATGAIVLVGGRWRALGALLIAALAVGVLWSNALAFHEVNLAPRSQLAELETIGGRIAGEGPTLMTEYQPYGARHFLRDAAPEGASELRRRLDPLLSGRGLPKGGYADTDRFELSSIMQYRTLVLRRSPSQSRPPSPYRLVWRGHYYEVWQRSPGAAGAVLDHLGLGSEVDPGGLPRCADVHRLAREAGPGGSLAAVPRRPIAAFAAAAFSHPRSWSVPGNHSVLVPDSSGIMRGTVGIRRSGIYTVWLGGGVRPQVDLLVDGREVGSVRDQLENSGQYVELGATRWRRGSHRIEIGFHAADLVPGSGGTAQAIGPIVLSPQDTADTRVLRFPPGQANRLCGRRWDWVEAVRRAS
jgi:hypothetical protein